jgi:hypothetical protein
MRFGSAVGATAGTDHHVHLWLVGHTQRMRHNDGGVRFIPAGGLATPDPG